MMIERRRIVFEGRVQGVGFRMTARQLASAYPLAGYVRNLDDGRVELVAEAEPDSLALFLLAIRREFGDMIRDMTEEVEASPGDQLSGFTIRY